MNPDLSAAASEERAVLRDFYEAVTAVKDLDSTISESKITKQARKGLKDALRGSEYRCTCAKRTWGGPCEVCQASDNELYTLRNFFRMISKAEAHGMTATEIQGFVENTKKSLAPPQTSKSKPKSGRLEQSAPNS